MQLRPYQHEALKVSLSKYQSGVTRQLLALPTGMGKTVVFANLPQHHQLQGRMLVLVHREELADQAADKLRKWNPTLKVGIEMGDRKAEADCDLVVASVQTLGRQGSARLLSLDSDLFSAIVCDEAHHSVAPSYKAVFDHFGLLAPDNAKLLLGVTATPNRGDKQALGLVYDEIVYQFPMLRAIQEGWLSNVRGLRVSTETSLDGVHTRAGDFAVNELEDAVNTPYRNGLIVQKWLEHASGLQSLVFTVDIQHAKDLAQTFKAYGVSAEAIWGDDPDRAEKLQYHRNEKLQVLTNCAVLTEGYDDWRIKCIVLARPTKSQLLFVQMTGRGTRIQEGIHNINEARERGVPIVKEDCLLMDVVDNTTRHSLITLASLFGLNPRLNMRSKTLTSVLGDLAKAEEEHPGIDLSRLDDIARLNALVEEVNLFTVKFAPEVVENSEFMWFKTGLETYKLYLPNNETVVIWQDLLGHWEVEGTVCGNHFKSESKLTTLPEAFEFAEKMLNLFGRDLLTLIRRQASWHDDPATPGQLSFLKKLGIHPPANISKGNASKLISQALHRKPFIPRKGKPAYAGTSSSI